MKRYSINKYCIVYNESAKGFTANLEVVGQGVKLNISRTGFNSHESAKLFLDMQITRTEPIIEASIRGGGQGIGFVFDVPEYYSITLDGLI